MKLKINNYLPIFKVESIERIDSAMLEVAQLQIMRHIFADLQNYLRSMVPPATPSTSRQNFTSGCQNQHFNEEPHSSTSTRGGNEGRGATHRTFPRCIFLMYKHVRTSAFKRTWMRDHTRRRYFRRSNVRWRAARISNDNTDSLERNLLTETLPAITRRLVCYLMEHARIMGTSLQPPVNVNFNIDVGECLLMLRLNNCRLRVNRLLGSLANFRHENTTVTRDGRCRYGVRHALVSAIDTIASYMEGNRNANFSQNLRDNVSEVIELSLLLSEILLLQIVDSIPPPTGMNLDTERESLSARIDQMCSRMLQSRLSGQFHQLSRSLRLMRMSVRHATHALGQTYTARRNAILPMGVDMSRRREIIDEIRRCFQALRRRDAFLTSENSLNRPSIREHLRQLNLDLTRLRDECLGRNSTVQSSNSEERQEGSSSRNADSGGEGPSRLYRTSNVNLLNDETPVESTSRNRPWDVPTVQVNDVPVSDINYSPWQPRIQRLTERLNELRANHPSVFRPRYLHPYYNGGFPNNPFDSDMDEVPREHIYDGDYVASIAPSHRIQMWKFSCNNIPCISNRKFYFTVKRQILFIYVLAVKNIVVSECKIHNDASVDVAKDGSMLVTLLPSGGYLNVTNRLGNVYVLYFG